LTTPTELNLLQVKIDFIEFMSQHGVSLGYDPTFSAVLYALLLENTYISKERIQELTGLSQRDISSIIKRLLSPSSVFYVLQTRIPNQKGKFYKMATSYEQYIQNILVSAYNAFSVNLASIPILIDRLDNLPSQNSTISHARDFLIYFYRIMNTYSRFVEFCSRNVEDLFHNPRFLDQIIPHLESSFEEDIIPSDPRLIPDTDSFQAIKRDWLDYLREFFAISSSLGKKQVESGQIIILHAINLENNPLTQEQLMKDTGYSRGKVSEILTELTQLGTVRIVKKPRDRKKYFTLNIPISSLIGAKYSRIRASYMKIGTTVKNAFLSKLLNSDSTDPSITYLKGLFEELIRLYSIAKGQMDVLLNFLSGKQL
jgi:DNA-binding transcriptional regulator GbsR (MarR family)